MATDTLSQYLEWDSQFFGRRIARVLVNRLNPDTLAEIWRWCTAEAIDCLYFLADPADRDTIRLVEDHGFRLVDMRLTFARSLSHLPAIETGQPQTDIRLAKPEDVPALRAIAKASHHDSRFYFDPEFSSAQADALYETWIEKSCNGYAEAVLVAQSQGQPAGYISCHLVDQTTGQIGLVGVGSAYQGQGWGGRLVNESLRWFAAQERTQVTVVTQGQNCKAQRLYQRCGFVTHSVQFSYHRWFTAKED